MFYYYFKRINTDILLYLNIMVRKKFRTYMFCDSYNPCCYF